MNCTVLFSSSVRKDCLKYFELILLITDATMLLHQKKKPVLALNPRHTVFLSNMVQQYSCNPQSIRLEHNNRKCYKYIAVQAASVDTTTQCRRGSSPSLLYHLTYASVNHQPVLDPFVQIYCHIWESFQLITRSL